MKKSDKTKTYTDRNKTSIYGDAEKLTKETVHNLKTDDNIVLNNEEYKIIEIISEITGEAVIYKIEDNRKIVSSQKSIKFAPKSPGGDFLAAATKSPLGDLGVNDLDLKAVTAQAFSHLIFNLWDSSTDKDIKFYFFRYEFALRQIKDKQPEV